MKNRFFYYLFFTAAALVSLHAGEGNASTWEYVGPDTVSFTAMHNFGNGHLIAATMIDGVGTRQPLYVSRNYGKTWDTLCLGFSYYKVEQFAFFGNKLYACLSDVFRTGLKSRGYETLFFSLDSGKTWNLVNDFTGDDAFWAIGKDSTIVTGNSYYVSKSSDNGKNWRTIDVKDNIGGVLVCYSVAMYNDTIYAGCHTGIWVSSDWGETWVFRCRDGATIYSLNFIGKILIYGTQASSAYSRNFGLESSWNVTLNLGPDHYTKIFPIKDSIAFATVQPQNSGKKTLCYFSTDSAKSFARFFIEGDTTVNIKVNGFFSDGVYAFALTKKGIYRRLIYENTSKIPFNNKPSTAKYTPVSINKNQIVLDMPANSTLKLTVFSLSGKTLKKIRLFQTNAEKMYLPVSDIAGSNGLYIIQATINTDAYTLRVVVQKYIL